MAPFKKATLAPDYDTVSNSDCKLMAKSIVGASRTSCGWERPQIKILQRSQIRLVRFPCFQTLGPMALALGLFFAALPGEWHFSPTKHRMRGRLPPNI